MLSWKMPLIAAAAVVLAVNPAHAGFVITPTFTANFNTNFGANAAAAQAAWIAAANVITTNFTDNIQVNITVDAVAGTGVFGQSSTFLNSFGFAATIAAVNADKTTADDNTAVGGGGSLAGADPTGGNGTFWVTRAEAKALGLIASDANNDGTTTFGAGNAFTFSGAIAGGTFDFQGVAAHEITEVLGRLGLGGGTVGSTANSYSLVDLFSFSGAGTRVLGNGGVGGEGSFSINAGGTLLMKYNDQASNGLDFRDWNTTGPYTPDSFNQFSNSGLVNPVTSIDLREMDVIGYDRASTVPEPSSAILLGLGLALGGLARRFRRSA